MATLNELKELALHAAKGTAPDNFTAGTVNDALRGELSEWCSSYANFERHKADLFEIISETVDVIVPKKVESSIMQFAEIKNVPQGQKAEFKRKNSTNRRGKAFVTRVGLAGIYETFRLAESRYTVNTFAMGSAARVDFENFLDGAENMAELINIIAQGYEENVYQEVTKALQGAAAHMKFNNCVVANTFNGDAMQKICQVVKSYGNGAAIFATGEFIDAMGVDVYVQPVTSGTPIVHPDDIDALHNEGRIKIFRGNPLVEMPQSFTDDTNKTYTIDPSYAYILPTGGEKVVKVVFEGDTHVKTVEDEDWTMEFRTYKKLGLAVHSFNNWGMYKNTSLSQTVFADGYEITDDHEYKPRNN